MWHSGCVGDLLSSRAGVRQVLLKKETLRAPYYSEKLAPLSGVKCTPWLVFREGEALLRPAKVRQMNKKKKKEQDASL